MKKFLSITWLLIRVVFKSMQVFGAKIAGIYRQQRLRFLYVSTRAKCPACGSRRKHSIVYNPQYQALLHKCAECNAMFSENPIYAASIWQLKQLPEQLEEHTFVPTADAKPIAKRVN